VTAYLIVALGLGIHVVLRELARRRRKPLIGFLASTATGYLVTTVFGFVFYACLGVPGEHRHVAEVKAGFDAAGKLEPGDVLVTVDGVPVSSTRALSDLVQAGRGAPVNVSFDRGGTRHEVAIRPTWDADGRRWMLGIVQDADLEGEGVVDATVDSLLFPPRDVAEIAGGFVHGNGADAGGPSRIVAEANRAFTSGTRVALYLLLHWSVLLMFAMLWADGIRAIIARADRGLRTPASRS
jgi:hypothetical protein